MKNRWKRIGVLFLGAALMLGIGGCGLFMKSYDFTEAADSIYIGENGTIKAAMIADFDKDYYDIDELGEVARAQALEYNQTYYGISYSSSDQMTDEEKKTMLLPVSFESAVKAEGKASLVFTYANGDTYTGFNSAEIALKGGSKVYTSLMGINTMSLDQSFVSADGKKTVTAEELAEKADYTVVYVDFPTVVYGIHDIAYVSSNVTVLGNNYAKVDSTEGSFIIFK